VKWKVKLLSGGKRRKIDKTQEEKLNEMSQLQKIEKVSCTK
jgi:hypothetical protein